jgi:outer membrane protein OmpA-like peptidoglycan-associated protein
MFLSEEKLNHAGVKMSFLDWLTKVAQEQRNQTLAERLKIPIGRGKGSYRYRIRLLLAYIPYGVAFGVGTLIVEKVGGQAWRGGRALYDVRIKGLATPGMPVTDEVFDLEVQTSVEWGPDDFEGSLFLGGAEASFGIPGASPKVSKDYATLRGKNGLVINFDFGGVSAEGDPGMPSKKPKLEFGAHGLWATIERQGNYVFDLSTLYPTTKSVVAGLANSVHFCIDSSLLTPAGRQYLRVVCAEQLALLTDPSSKIVLVGHTDRLDTFRHNLDLARLRVDNVKQALQDILGNQRSDWDKIPTYAPGELFAMLKLKPNDKASPEDRRVDLLVNGLLVARFNDIPATRTP